MTTALTDTSCPLCEGQTKAYAYGPSDLRLRQCGSCAIVYLAHAAQPSCYVEEMEETFFSDEFLSRQAGWQKLFDRLIIRRTLKRIRRFKCGGRLLEVGVGNGNFLRAARQAGFDCMGIESSPYIAEHVQKNYDLPIFQGYLKDFADGPTREGFDVIVINHVLEHIPDPDTALKQLRSLLADGGVVHLAVPNVNGWEARLRGWTSYEPYHLYYFSPETLLPLLDKVGFEVLRLETVEPFSGWFNALIRTVWGSRYQALRGAENSNGGERSSTRRFLFSNVFNTGRVAFGLLTFPARLVQARLNKGEELIAVVKVS